MATDLPEGPATVVLTGGTTAARIYPELAEASGDWSGIEVLFSDERCVPPSDDASNFGMAKRLLLDRLRPTNVHRMRGENPPEAAAAAYDRDITVIVDRGIDLMLLGLGDDCHICALFPGSPGLDERTRLCIAVDRPDGMRGLTLTPPAIRSARKTLVLVAGEGKAEAVERALRGNEPPEACPARLLADLPEVTFVVDEAAAGRL